MTHHRHPSFSLLLLALTLAASAQTTPASQPPSPNQAQFREAVQAFQAKHFDLALADFKQLIAADPPPTTSIRNLPPSPPSTSATPPSSSPRSSPSNSPIPPTGKPRALLARAYAQTPAEPGHRQKRDEEVAAITRLHLQDPNSQLGKLRDFLLETVTQGDKTIQFYPALTPWGPYHVHLIARTFDPSGQPGLRMTLESGDGDQPLFAQQHPTETAAGQRSFSLDGYAPDQKSPDGQTIQTHYTFAFFTGQPSYDEVRQKVLDIATGKLKAMSSRSGPISSGPIN